MPTGRSVVTFIPANSQQVTGLVKQFVKAYLDKFHGFNFEVPIKVGQNAGMATYMASRPDVLSTDNPNPSGETVVFKLPNGKIFRWRWPPGTTTEVAFRELAYLLNTDRDTLSFDIDLPDIGFPPYIDQFPTTLTNPIFVRQSAARTTADVTVRFGAETFQVTVPDNADLSIIRAAIHRQLSVMEAALGFGPFDLTLTSATGAALTNEGPVPALVTVALPRETIVIDLVIGGEVRTLEISSRTEIAQIRTRLSGEFGIAKEDVPSIDFFYLGRRLSDNFSVRRVIPGLRIVIAVPSVRPRDLDVPLRFVLKGGDAPFPIETRGDGTVADIRKKVAEHVGVPLERILLSAGRVMLFDHLSIHRLGIPVDFELEFAVDDVDTARYRSEISAALASKKRRLFFTIREDEAEVTPGLSRGTEDTADSETERKVIEALTADELKRIQDVKREHALVEMTRFELISLFLECRRDFDRLEQSLLLE
jgi:hypothetical protein